MEAFHSEREITNTWLYFGFHFQIVKRLPYQTVSIGFEYLGCESCDQR